MRREVTCEQKLEEGKGLAMQFNEKYMSQAEGPASAKALKSESASRVQLGPKGQCGWSRRNKQRRVEEGEAREVKGWGELVVRSLEPHQVLKGFWLFQSVYREPFAVVRGTAPYLSIRKEKKVLVYSLARLSDLQKYHFKTKISEGEGRIS